MDLKQIERLMAAMERAQIKRIALKRENFEIEIEREGGGGPTPALSSAMLVQEPLASLSQLLATRTPPVPEPLAVEQNQQKHLEKKDPAAVYVTSPMVGTFYATPSPEEPPFIKVGDQINEGSIVAIIEAMKVMNEVKAGVKGTISEVLVRNGEPVEFGTPLFRVVL